MSFMLCYDVHFPLAAPYMAGGDCFLSFPPLSLHIVAIEITGLHKQWHSMHIQYCSGTPRNTHRGQKAAKCIYRDYVLDTCSYPQLGVKSHFQGSLHTLIPISLTKSTRHSENQYSVLLQNSFSYSAPDKYHHIGLFQDISLLPKYVGTRWKKNNLETESIAKAGCVHVTQPVPYAPLTC